MNWLIISPSVKDKNLKRLEDFFENKQKIVPKEVFVRKDMPVQELQELIRTIMQATHCVIVDSGMLYELQEYTMILGILLGRHSATFIYDGKPYEKRYEDLNGESRAVFHVFSDLSQMLEQMEVDFVEFRSAAAQRSALVQLFTLGIPFTSDCFAEYLAKDDTEKCQMFYDAGMQVNARTSDGVPLLCIATRNDCIDKVKWLVQKGADINEISADRGYSAVMDAVWRKNYEITKYLVDQGADLSFISSDGQPILVLAVGNGNVKIVELLLASGADPDIQDSMGMSARSYANLFKKPGMVELLEKYPKKDAQ